MSLEEYRERQRLAYLARKRERESNGEATSNGVGLTSENIMTSESSAFPSSAPLSFSVCPSQHSEKFDTSNMADASSSNAPGIASATCTSIKTLLGTSSARRASASPSHGSYEVNDTSNDALLAQFLAEELEAEAKRASQELPSQTVSNEVDEASAAVIAKILAAEMEAGEDIRVADPSFQEQLIEGHQALPQIPSLCNELSPSISAPFEEPGCQGDISDDLLARRLQEEEFSRENPPNFSPRWADEEN